MSREPNRNTKKKAEVLGSVCQGLLVASPQKTDPQAIKSVRKGEGPAPALVVGRRAHSAAMVTRLACARSDWAT